VVAHRQIRIGVVVGADPAPLRGDVERDPGLLNERPHLVPGVRPQDTADDRLSSAFDRIAKRSPAGHCDDYAISVGSPMEFEWDEAKHTKTLRERGVGFDDAARIFAGPVLIWEDARRDYGEVRFRAVGETDGDILH